MLRSLCAARSGGIPAIVLPLSRAAPEIICPVSIFSMYPDISATLRFVCRTIFIEMAPAITLTWTVALLWLGHCHTTAVTTIIQSAGNECNYKPPSWSRQRFCRSDMIGTCNEGTCRSCEDCQLKFPGVLPALANFTCINSTTYQVQWVQCPVKKCSYCLGCNTSALVQLALDASEGMLLCSGCDVTYSVFWGFDTTLTGRLGACNVTLSCNRRTTFNTDKYGSTRWYSPALMPDYRCTVYNDPAIEKVTPAGGPMAGGTVITIIGTNLINVAAIFIGESGCDFSEFRFNITNTTARCRTPSSAANGWMSLRMVTATLPVKQIIITQQFEYRPNPQVDVIEKPLTIAAGGIKVSFVGVNLGAADSPVMTVTAVCSRTNQSVLANYTGRCTAAEDQTRLVCITPDVSSVLSFDCPPSVGQALQAAPNNSFSKYDFMLGLLFDGFQGYDRLPTLPQFQKQGFLQVYDNVKIHRFTEDNSVRTFNPERDSIIIIYGENMDSGARISDYAVSMGDGSQCVMLSLFSNQLTCKPPAEEPPVDRNNFIAVNGKQAVSVVVCVGYLTMVVGYVTYTSATATWLVILLGTLLPASGIAVAAALTVVCIRRRHRQKGAGVSKRSRSDRQSLNLYQNVPISQGSTYRPIHDSSLMLPMLPIKLRDQLAPYSIPRGSVTLGELLGQGHFGKIYRATVKGKTRAAAKCLRDECLNSDTAAKFLEEAVLMKDFQHINVLCLLGVVMDGHQPIVLVPIMELGDLRSALKKQVFPLGDLVNFCQQVATGMAYLASRKFIHRDLAARNCLLDEGYTVKISDFGLSHELDVKDYYRGQDHTKPLPVKWMAIESLSNGVFTTASDVWSYGVVMWEIVAKGSVPYADVNNYDIKRYLQSGHRLECPTGAPEALYSIMRKCWNSMPMRRPSFADLLSLIEAFVTSSTAPIMERLFTKVASSEPYSYAVCDQEVHSQSQRPDLEDPQYLEVIANVQ